MSNTRTATDRLSSSFTPRAVEAKLISKSFPRHDQDSAPLPVLRQFSLSLAKGELATLFGPNGCGKTTILNILAGITQPDEGVVLSESDGSADHGVGYVFQNYADTLLPWRTVSGNVALPLEFRRVPSDQIAKRVNERLRQFHLKEHAEKFVYQLSGGLKQLVSICRAAVYDPRLLLLDEPFSALDYSLSRTLWLRFREFWTAQKVTTVFVSHNIDEAVFLGDRVCVLSARPAQVVADIVVPFGPERPLSLLASSDFFSVRSQVLEAFEQGRQQ